MTDCANILICTLLNNKFIMESILISIIVPVYNVEKYLEKCINSILNQTHTNIEVLLVDDGSTDKSGLICDELATKDNRVISLHKNNGGLSSARNYGLDFCNGEFIGFVDSDDYIEKDMFEKLLSANIVNGTKISCGGRYDVYENKDNRKKIGLCPSINAVIDSEEGIKRLLTWKEIDSASTDKLFHKSIWKNIRFPLNRVSEDVAVMYLAFHEAESISLVASPFYNYNHRNGSITTSSFDERKFDILTNIKEIDSFIRNSYRNLVDDFAYFKVVEYSHILRKMLYTKKKYLDLQKELITGIKDNKKIFSRFKFKQKIKLMIFSNYTFYSALKKICSFCRCKANENGRKI